MNRMINRTYVYVMAVVFAAQIACLCGCSVSVQKKEDHPEKPKINVISMDDESEEFRDEGYAYNEGEYDTDTEQDSYSGEEEAELPSQTLVELDQDWKYADYSVINSGSAVLHSAKDSRKNIVVAVNAGHGTKGGQNVKTYCHPDKSPKVTGGSTAEGSVKAAAVSSGMKFDDGTEEATATLELARLLRDRLLEEGYDVLMLRDDTDVQLDNIARTVIANNTSDCMISIHWDGDDLDYDKGCFYISVPEELKNMEPVSQYWAEHNRLGEALIDGLRDRGCKIYDKGSMDVDLTQMSYSMIPSVDIEMGNQSSKRDEQMLDNYVEGLVLGVDSYFGSE